MSKEAPTGIKEETAVMITDMSKWATEINDDALSAAHTYRVRRVCGVRAPRRRLCALAVPARVDEIYELVIQFL